MTDQPTARKATHPAVFYILCVMLIGSFVWRMTITATEYPSRTAQMLEMAEVGPGDHVIDLGTGDGRILIAAARERGARGLGIDIDPVMVAKAQANAERAGVADRVRFETADLFKTDLAEADVVTMFLLPEVNLRLRPRLLAQLKPGTRIVSHAFDMGDWRPDETRRVGGAVVHLWRVPERGRPATAQR